jgi:hypothetical protein
VAKRPLFDVLQGYLVKIPPPLEHLCFSDTRALWFLAPDSYSKLVLRHRQKENLKF